MEKPTAEEHCPIRLFVKRRLAQKRRALFFFSVSSECAAASKARVRAVSVSAITKVSSRTKSRLTTFLDGTEAPGLKSTCSTLFSEFLSDPDNTNAFIKCGYESVREGVSFTWREAAAESASNARTRRAVDLFVFFLLSRSLAFCLDSEASLRFVELVPTIPAPTATVSSKFNRLCIGVVFDFEVVSLLCATTFSMAFCTAGTLAPPPTSSMKSMESTPPTRFSNRRSGAIETAIAFDAARSVSPS
mmetsp:Transcript_14683/g.48601  ORF Transcript_14683/g.48601 Transcript_14683/m.48601 type:complete len:246 (+) Transcript_14683:924-1661(+)